MASKSIVIDLVAKTAKFNSGLDKASKRLKTFGGSATRLGRTMSVRVTLPIVAAGAALFKFASDAIESENLFEVAMGGMANEARAFSENLRSELGLNAFELRKQTGILFQMTTAMGISRDASFEMSTGLTKLTQDMASFFNLPTEEAFMKIQSGLVGEIEPLRRLGILVDEQTVRQALMNKGLIKGSEVLTQQQKVMGRYLAILDQTKNAQGDLARTLDSPTNKFRILGSRLKEVAIRAGTALMPAFEMVLKGLERIVDSLQAGVEWFDKQSSAVKTATVVMVGFAAAVGPAALAVGGLSKAMGALIVVAGAAKVNFVALAATMKTTATAGGALLGLFVALQAGLSIIEFRARKGEKEIAEFGERAAKTAGEVGKIADAVKRLREESPKAYAAAKVLVEDLAAKGRSRTEAWAIALLKVENGTLKIGEAANEASEAIRNGFGQSSEVNLDYWTQYGNAMREVELRTHAVGAEFTAMAMQIPDAVPPVQRILSLTEQLQIAANSVADSFGNQFASAVIMGTQKAGKAWRVFLQSIMAQLAAMAATQAFKWVIAFAANPAGIGGALMLGLGDLLGFQSGGTVGAGTQRPGSRDVIPALLSPGERVIPASQPASAASGGSTTINVHMPPMSRGMERIAMSELGRELERLGFVRG